MVLPTSGPLSLADIQTEFGGANPIGLNEYYAGGAYVPAGTSGTNGAVPSSGAISIWNFYGTSAVTGPTISLLPITAEDRTGRVYRAGFVVNNTGTITAIAGVTSSINLPQDWTNDGGATAGNYDVRCTTTSGTPLDADDGVWLNLATSRTFALTGTASGSGTIEIRLSSSGVVKASSTFSLIASP